MINTKTFKEIISSNLQNKCKVLKKGEGYLLSLEVGEKEIHLATSRGEERIFKTLDVACAYAKGMGVESVDVSLK